MKIHRITNGPIDENAYIVWDPNSREAILIDPGFSTPTEVKEFLDIHGLHLGVLINTHGHWDHIMNNALFKEGFNAKLLIHEDETEFLSNDDLNLSGHYKVPLEHVEPDGVLHENDEVWIGDEVLTVLHTPGHTAGGIILYNKDMAFTGDTLFNGSIGRCDLPSSDKDAMMETLSKLRSVLPATAKIFSGHGSLETTFQDQLMTNPFLTGTMKPR